MDDHAICYIPEKQFGLEIIPDQSFIRSFVPVLESIELDVNLAWAFYSALTGANLDTTLENASSFVSFTTFPPTIDHPEFPGDNLPF